MKDIKPSVILTAIAMVIEAVKFVAEQVETAKD